MTQHVKRRCAGGCGRWLIADWSKAVQRCFGCFKKALAKTPHNILYPTEQEITDAVAQDERADQTLRLGKLVIRRHPKPAFTGEAFIDWEAFMMEIAAELELSDSEVQDFAEEVCARIDEIAQ